MNSISSLASGTRGARCVSFDSQILFFQALARGSFLFYAGWCKNLLCGPARADLADGATGAGFSVRILALTIGDFRGVCNLDLNAGIF